MHYSIIFTKHYRHLMFSFLVSLASTVVADNSNPWAVPQASSNLNQFESEQADEQKQPKKHWRFVTPRILDSIKKQQMEAQLIPDQSRKWRQNQNPRAFRAKPSARVTSPYYRQPRFAPQSIEKNTPFGMNYTDPIYDAPDVSPWGQGPDVLYRGESFPDTFSGTVPLSWGDALSSGAYPLVPKEAVGGIPPINTPAFGNFNYGNRRFGELENTNMDDSESGTSERQIEDNVFNPFTFIQNRNLH